MNITLLEYIHSLMIHQEKNLRNEVILKKEQLKKAEKEKDKNIAEINDKYEAIKAKHEASYYLLKEFEQINWK